MLCNFINMGGGWYRCANCNIQLRSPDNRPPVFPCRHQTFKTEQDTETSFAKKVKNFIKSSTEHIANGMQLCSDETISKRYSICLSCPFFKDKACTKCGCPIYRHKRYISKLSWESEKCPEGKW